MIIGSDEISEGKIFEGTLKISKNELNVLGSPDSLIQKFIFKKLFISEILNINEGEEIEVIFLGVAIAPLEPNENDEIEIGDRKITVTLESVNFKQNNITPKQEFLLYELSDGILKKINKVILLLGSLVFLAFCILSFKFFEKRNRKKQLDQILKEEVKFWKDQIKGANERKDFEHIYLKRNLWKKVLAINKDVKFKFLEQLNEIQYKKEWNSYERKNLEDEFINFKNKVL